MRIGGFRIGLVGVLVFLSASVVLVYATSVQNGFVNIDDGPLIVHNSAIRGFSVGTLGQAFGSYDPELYIPLTLLSYQWDYTLCGLKPACYHATSLGLHILNTILVFGILWLFLGNVWLAVGLALLFGVHPLHTEAVAWASARKDLVGAAGFLSSLLSYLFFVRRGERRWYWLSLGCFVAGVLGKISAVPLPLVLLLVDHLEQRESWAERLREKLPFFAVAVVFGIVALLGKQAMLADLSGLDHVLLTAKAAGFLLLQFLWPAQLVLLYPQSLPVAADPTVWLGVVVFVILVALSIWQLRRRSLLGVGLSMYVLLLLPIFGGFAKKEFVFFVSDRFAYLPSVGLLIAVGWGLLWFWRRWTALRGVLTLFLFIVSGVFGWMAHERSLAWSTTGTLHEANVAGRPHSYMHTVDLAAYYLDQGEVQQAIDLLERAVKINPDHPRAYANLGYAYGQLGEYETGIRYYAEAVKRDPEAKIPAEVRNYLER